MAISSICKDKQGLARFEETEHAYAIFLQDLHELYDTAHRRHKTRPRYPDFKIEAVEEALKRERQTWFDHREVLTDYQFQRFHDAINKMVDDLIKQSYFDECPGGPVLARRNIESLDSTWTAIRLLRSEGYPQYTHPSIDPEAAQAARDELSEKIDHLFEQNREQIRIKPVFQIAKICHSILVCKYPPTIHHYNALLLGFFRQDMFNLVDLVAAALLQDSRLRSTEQTIVCLLLHYRKLRDIQGFYGIVRRLVGNDPRGLLRTRRLIAPGTRFVPHVEFASRPDVVLRSDQMAVVTPERTPDIYNALIAGALSFDRTKDAVKLLHACLQEGVGITFELLYRVCRQTVYRLNTPLQRLLTRVLLNNPRAVTIILRGKFGDLRMTEWLWSLLSLDQVRSGYLYEQRQEILRSARWMHIPTHSDGPLRTVATAVFIRHSMRKLHQLQAILLSAKQLMAPPKWPMQPNSLRHSLERTVLATKIIKRLDLTVDMTNRRANRALKYWKLFGVVRALEKATWGVQPYNVTSCHERTVRMLLVYFPTTAAKGSIRHKEHVEKLEQLADNWLRHRVRRKEGVVGTVRRLVVEVELSLYYGERLLRQYRELVGEKERRGSPPWSFGLLSTPNLRIVLRPRPRLRLPMLDPEVDPAA